MYSVHVYNYDPCIQFNHRTVFDLVTVQINIYNKKPMIHGDIIVYWVLFLFSSVSHAFAIVHAETETDRVQRLRRDRQRDGDRYVSWGMHAIPAVVY